VVIEIETAIAVRKIVTAIDHGASIGYGILFHFLFFV